MSSEKETVCPFKEICLTTNYWVEEKADFIKSTCNTEMHGEILKLGRNWEGRHKAMEVWKCQGVALV